MQVSVAQQRHSTCLQGGTSIMVPDLCFPLVPKMKSAGKVQRENELKNEKFVMQQMPPDPLK
jgi:hypothetical protein